MNKMTKIDITTEELLDLFATIDGEDTEEDDNTITLADMTEEEFEDFIQSLRDNREEALKQDDTCDEDDCCGRCCECEYDNYEKLSTTPTYEIVCDMELWNDIIESGAGRLLLIPEDENVHECLMAYFD